MGITILGGALRGLSLKVPKGDVVRPTSVLLRRRIFDAQQDLDGYVFVDICAGSGAVGIEALSRGASALYFIEPNKTVFRILHENLEELKKKLLSENSLRPVHCKMVTAEKWISEFKITYLAMDEERRHQTILYLDPPYENHSLYQKIIDFLKGGWFQGEIWVESDRQKGKPSDFWQSLGVVEIKLYAQGTSYVLKGKIC